MMPLRTLLVLLWIGATASAASAITRDAPIVDVSVYPDRAVVTRSTTTAVPAGVSEISFSNLTESLLDESLQVAVRSSGGLAILDVRSAIRFDKAEETERLQPLLKKQEELRKKIDLAQIDLTLLERQRGFLNKIEDAATSTDRTEGDLTAPENWRSLIAFLDDSFSDLLPRIHETSTLLQELKDEIKIVNQQIVQTRDTERTRTKEAIVRIEAVEALGDAVFTLSYVVMNAGWSPAYNVRVRSADKRIQLEYQANVRQRTGEDWNSVNLTLSTARPALGGTPPELGRWILDVRRPLPAQGRSSFAFEDSVARAGKMESPPPMRPADVETSLTSVNLRVPVKTSIPADNQPHRAGVASTFLEGDFFYTLVPKLSPHAFLQSRVVYAGSAPMLPGATAIFLDGNLVGHSHLPRIESEEEFDLPLGVDEAILVERKLLRRFAEQRGLISKTTRTRFEFQTIVTNRRSTEETFVIEDHVPVSQQEKIKVELIQLSGGVADDDKPGLYTWRKKLAPGAKVAIPLVFTVEHPEDMDVSGL